MKRTLLAACLALLLSAPLFAPVARAQEEIPPPSGKGRAVVLAAGQDVKRYREVANRIAALGYDVVLFDTATLDGTQGRGLRSAAEVAQLMPHASKGKVGIVAFATGGGQALAFGSAWSDLVGVIVAWYPATSLVKDMKGATGNITVPVVMLAGEQDADACCTLARAREFAAAATAWHAPFELTTYPGTPHDFVVGGIGYKAEAFTDAFERTEAALKKYLAN